jgi:antirestriction protein ArdC
MNGEIVATRRKAKGFSLEELAASVTQSVDDCLARGVIPWAAGWTGVDGMGFGAQRGVSGIYRGINQILTSAAALNGGFTESLWLTRNQIIERGGFMLKGEHATKVVLWKPVTRKAEQRPTETEQQDSSYVLMRYYNVWNVQQTTLYEEPTPETADASDLEVVEGRRTFEDLTEARDFAAAYLKGSGVRLRHIAMPRGSAPHYTPAEDRITMPQVEQFGSPEVYAAVLFHEITHSTGHPDRTGRLTEDSWWKTDGRAREELTAELGAAMMSAMVGIDNAGMVENHAAYIKSWRQVIKSEPRLLINAAQRAQKAVDFAIKAAEGTEQEQAA